MDHIAFVRSESDRFRAALAGVDPTAPVPSCPDWAAADLLWHLAEVQSFWAQIVGRRLSEPGDAVPVARPDGWDELMDLSQRSTAELLDALDVTPAGTPVWSWADDRTAGFSRRRQAHEALIHRLDAELVSDELTAFDPALAADGVAEMFDHFLGGAPPWADTTDGPGLVAVHATDTHDAWLVQQCRFSGTSPNTGTVYAAEPFVRLVGAGTPTAEVVGRAEDLDAWLWGRRSTEALTLSGDGDHLRMLLDLVARGVD